MVWFAFKHCGGFEDFDQHRILAVYRLQYFMIPEHSSRSVDAENVVIHFPEGIWSYEMAILVPDRRFESMELRTKQTLNHSEPNNSVAQWGHSGFQYKRCGVRNSAGRGQIFF